MLFTSEVINSLKISLKDFETKLGLKGNLSWIPMVFEDSINANENISLSLNAMPGIFVM
jgi:hypothetical protein